MNLFGTFKQYLSESKKTYSFRVKIAGALPEGCEKNMKECLAKFDCAAVKSVSRTPIQESPMDFPALKNLEVHTFDIDCNYPSISPAVKDQISEVLGIPQGRIVVRTPQEQAEIELNQSHMKVPGEGESLLEKDYEKNDDAQKLVGETHVTSFLKELDKINAERKAKIVKHEGKEEGGMSDPEFEEPKDSKKSPLKGLTGNPDPRKGK
jgi:hypothetical protein